MKQIKLKNFKKRLIPFFMIVLFTSISAFSQGVVTGTVSDASGVPIAGATVLEIGTQNGAVSDFDGNYTITLQNSSSQLTFSFIGYKSQSKAAVAGQPLNIVLEEDLAQLDEVVVIGYGSVKRSDITMAVSSVGAKSFEDQPIFRAEDALQSRAAGVQVVKSTGAPGGGVKLRIRGTSSINRSSQPLLVVDGVVGGAFSSINPNDIQSIDILKDASAAAIYGARGANGVILVTTKRGGGEPKIELNYFTSVSKLPNRVDVLSPQEYANVHGLTLIGNGTDLQDEYFKTAITNNYQMSARGQEGKLKYYLSANYVDQEGIVINSNSKRLALRSNMETKFGDKLKVGLNISGSRTKGLNLFRGGARASADNRGGILSILTYNPTFPTRNPDGSYYDLEPQAVGSILVNPIAVQTEANNNSTEDRLAVNLNLSYDFSSNFNYSFIAGSNLRNSRNENYTLIPDGSSVLPPRAGFSTGTLTNYQLSNILTFNKDFGNTNLVLTGVYEVTKNENRTSGGGSGPYAQDGIPNAFYLLNELGTTLTANAHKTEVTLESFVGRAQIKIGENLNLTGGLRVDKSSTFRPENRTGYFPSASASYSFKNFMSDDTLFNNVTLRAGWGQVGNDGSFLGTFSSFRSRQYAFDGVGLSTGLGYGGQVDPDLKWEASEQINIGLDFVLLEDVLNLSVDWYKKNSKDLLLNAPLPFSAGDPNNQFTTNLGEIQNTGLDINLNADIINNENFSWNANFNISSVKNEVLDLGDVDQLLFQPPNIGGAGQTTTYALQVGEPLGQMWGLTFLGTYKTGETGGAPGESKYVLDEEGEPEFGVIGNGLPELTWGLSNTINYKGFNLNVLLRGVSGFDVYNDTYAQMVNGKSPNHRDVLNAFVEGSNENEFPSESDGLNSDRFVENGNFIRLSNLTLGYTFKDLKFTKSLQVYASGQNLFTITNYRGLDPEVSSTTTSNDVGPSYDKGAFPNPRTFTLGLNLNF